MCSSEVWSVSIEARIFAKSFFSSRDIVSIRVNCPLVWSESPLSEPRSVRCRASACFSMKSMPSRMTTSGCSGFAGSGGAGCEGGLLEKGSGAFPISLPSSHDGLESCSNAFVS